MGIVHSAKGLARCSPPPRQSRRPRRKAGTSTVYLFAGSITLTCLPEKASSPLRLHPRQCRCPHLRLWLAAATAAGARPTCQGPFTIRTFIIHRAPLCATCGTGETNTSSTPESTRQMPTSITRASWARAATAVRALHPSRPPTLPSRPRRRRRRHHRRVLRPCHSRSKDPGFDCSPTPTRSAQLPPCTRVTSLTRPIACA